METPNIGVVMSIMGGGVKLPPHDAEVWTPIGSTNNIGTIEGFLGGVNGTSVGVLTFTYVGSGAANDDVITSIVLTTPTANG